MQASRGGLALGIGIALTVVALATPAHAQQVVVQGQVPYPPPYAQPQPYVQPQYVQPQYVQPAYYAPAPVRQARTERRANVGLIVGGAVMLGVSWIANIAVGLPAGDDPFSSGSDPTWDSFRYSSLIPLAGPWVQLAIKPTGFTQDYWAVWLLLDGILQLTGTTLLVIGAATHRTVTVYAEASSGFELAVLPMASPEHAGLVALGRF